MFSAQEKNVGRVCNITTAAAKMVEVYKKQIVSLNGECAKKL